MAALDNPRHEAFAQAVASGKKGAVAYRQVYGEHLKGARSQASTLMKDHDVSKRVKEIQQKTAHGVVMTLHEELEYLTRAVQTPLDQVDETSVLCQRAKYSEAGRELWMVDKLRALELLAKLKGELKGDAATRVEVSVAVILSEEKRKELMDRRHKALTVGNS